MEYILREFAERSNFDLCQVVRPRILDVVRSNLGDIHARHLMLLTKNNAALRLLFDQELLKYNRTEVIFGSDFPGDRSDLNICLV